MMGSSMFKPAGDREMGLVGCLQKGLGYQLGAMAFAALR